MLKSLKRLILDTVSQKIKVGRIWDTAYVRHVGLVMSHSRGCRFFLPAYFTDTSAQATRDFLFVFNPCVALGSRVVSVLDSGAEGPRFKSQSRRCRVTVLGKLFTPIVPLFTKQQNW